MNAVVMYLPPVKCFLLEYVVCIPNLFNHIWDGLNFSLRLHMPKLKQTRYDSSTPLFYSRWEVICLLV